MSVREEIIHTIERKSTNHTESTKYAPINEETNLYADIKMNSFSFVKLLLEIEEKYQITFGLAEMEKCLTVGSLIDTVERKIKEKAPIRRKP